MGWRGDDYWKSYALAIEKMREMIPQLRQYQVNGSNSIAFAWSAGHRNVLYVLPTGGGKTVLFSKVLQEHRGAGVAIAHRQELVGQISLSLSRFGIRHRIIAPRKVIANILTMQRDELKKTFYDPTANIGVAGVDTLIRLPTDDPWLNQVTLWVQDEAHHVLQKNKWGKAVAMLPNARGLGVTATPERADGRGLGADADGVFNTMIIGPSMRNLINDKYLCDYRIFAPPGDLDLSTVRVAGDGDYNRNDVRGAVRRSHIIGDVVTHYRRIADGLCGVTFASDVETAGEIAEQYVAAGIPAAMVSAKTPAAARNLLIQKFRRRELTQLVNVDLFGEGFDVPGIEVVTMARPTKSFAVYAQQFGRALRPLEGKESAIIIDHVGNVQRHRLPDAVRTWSLASRERSARAARDPEMIPVTTCTGCFRVYESIMKSCPFCGLTVTPAGRARPEQVDGDLFELDPDALRVMRGEVNRIDGPVIVPEGMTGAAAGGLVKRWRERQEAQTHLRNQIAAWAGVLHAQNISDSEIMRRFYFRFDTDIITAQTFGRTEAERLTAAIYEDINK